jgi:RsiW-degrading membrane proteinase PrsW (M82 family)
MSTLRWLLPSLLPAVLVAVGLYLSDKRREPPWLVVTTFLFGAAAAFVAHEIVGEAAKWTGLDIRSAAGDSGALLFLFAVAAPVREMAKVAATWPAFRSRHFDEPYDGVVYSGVAAMGFAALDSAIRLRAHPAGSLWIMRALLAVPAHLFFATLWGYSLGRVKQQKRPGAFFPMAWLVATIAHGLYAHFTFGRGPAALIALVPMLLVMGVVSGFAARDLVNRGDRPSRAPSADAGNEAGDAMYSRLSRPSMPPTSSPTSSGRGSGRASGNPPSLRAVREALTRHDQPIRLRWILFGSVVTLGAMIAGLAGSVAFGHWAHVDFSIVDERDVATTGPVAILGAGLLAAFPLSGFLIARASSVPTLLEPALATALAILATLVLLGLAAPVALVFALAFSPVAFALACAGAWVGRPAR